MSPCALVFTSPHCSMMQKSPIASHPLTSYISLNHVPRDGNNAHRSSWFWASAVLGFVFLLWLCCSAEVPLGPAVVSHTVQPPHGTGVVKSARALGALGTARVRKPGMSSASDTPKGPSALPKGTASTKAMDAPPEVWQSEVWPVLSGSEACWWGMIGVSFILPSWKHVTLPMTSLSTIATNHGFVVPVTKRCGVGGSYYSRTDQFVSRGVDTALYPTV